MSRGAGSPSGKVSRSGVMEARGYGGVNFIWGARLISFDRDYTRLGDSLPFDPGEDATRAGFFLRRHRTNPEIEVRLLRLLGRARGAVTAMTTSDRRVILPRAWKSQTRIAKPRLPLVTSGGNVMPKAEIDALVHAHRGHARAVAFLHVLRQTTLGEDDQTFLQANAAGLTAPDLLRWRARTAPAGRAPILVALAKMAEGSPSTFEHEVLNAPGLSFDDREWETLADLLREKVPPALHARVVQKNALPPPHAKSTEVALFSPDGEPPVDLAAMLSFDDAPKAEAVTDDLVGSLFGEGSLEGELGLDFDGDDKAPFFADPFEGLSTEDAQEKLFKSENPDERAMLIEWLESRGVDELKLVSSALVTLLDSRWPVPAPIVSWMGKKLAKKETFTLNGVAFFSALVQRRAYTELQEVLAQAQTLAGGDMSAVLFSFAGVLLDEARYAIRAKDEPRAEAALAGLACIDVPEAMRPRFKLLKEALKRAKASPILFTLADINARFAREGKTAPRSAPLEAMIAAVHAYSDARG